MSDAKYKEIFSKNLRQLMSANDKTQIDIINDLGFDKSAVSTWCNGTRLPRMDKVDALAKYFGVNRSDLIEECSDNSPACPYTEGNEQNIILSKNLSRLLSEHNKTQKEVADAICVSPQTFNTWMQGIAIPRMEKIQLLADYFNIKKADLIDETPDALPSSLQFEDNTQEFNALFSTNLSIQLKIHGMTQADLAKRLNVTTASVSNWCRGLKIPRMDKIDKMCEMFGCQRSDLLTTSLSTASQLPELREDEKELLKYYNKLNTTGKVKVIEYTEDLTYNLKCAKNIVLKNA